MSYRDVRLACPICDVALEPMAINRDVDASSQTRSSHLRLLVPRPIRIASWTQYSCSTCKGVLLEADHLALLVDTAAGNVLRLERRLAATGKDSVQCPRCAAKTAEHALFGQLVGRCSKHGVWLAGGRLVAILAAARATATPI